jgi:hypothetical protein
MQNLQINGLHAKYCKQNGYSAFLRPVIGAKLPAWSSIHFSMKKLEN